MRQDSNSNSKKQRRNQKGANYLNSVTYMESINRNPNWFYETFNKLTEEKRVELFKKYTVFSCGVLLFDPNEKSVILGEYNDPRKLVKDDLSHFGGGLRLTEGETPLSAAIRELGQESQWLLSLKSNLSECPGIIAVHPGRNFCYITFFGLCREQNIDEIKNTLFPAKFEEALARNDKIEVKSIKTIKLDQFVKMINDDRERFLDKTTQKKFKIYETIRRIISEFEKTVGIEKTFNRLVEISKRQEEEQILIERPFLFPDPPSQDTQSLPLQKLYVMT